MDLIPFGGLEQEAHQIAWPPDMNVVMNVTGYTEALASALDVDTGGGRVIRVVSIPSLAALIVVHMTRSAGNESDTADKLLGQFELGLRTKQIPRPNQAAGIY